MLKNIRYFLLMILLFMGISSACSAQSPTPWRGPSSNGIYPDKGLLNEWPAEGPEILWFFEELGKGHSSPVPLGEYIYATGMIESTGYLFKLDLNGKMIYRAEYGPEFAESYYGTRGSPVIAGDRIYIISGKGHLYCLRERDGEEVWSVDMVKEYGGRMPRWGYNETVSIDGDVLYCTPGGRKSNVLALNRQNGSLIWSCEGKGESSAYCSPLLFSHGGRKILATHTTSHLLGIDAATGTLLWDQSQTNTYSVHANTPIYYEGGLLYFSGYGKGAGKLDLNGDGTAAKPAWKNSGFDSRVGGAVIVDGYLYGAGDNSRAFKCINWSTGDTVYTDLEISKGNIISADGKLYCYTERGELALVNPNPHKFELVSKTKVDKGSEQHWAHPAIHRGVLYLRHGKSLITYQIK